jgi:hypothetical protein
MKRLPAHVLAGLLLVALGVVVSGCQQVLGIQTRTNPQNLECSDESCTCDAGFGDCDNKLSNGCETDLSNASADCGACGNQCTNGSCQMGSCSCSANYGDCDADPKNGCEGSLVDDPHSCGACGHDCLGGDCVAGACQPFQIASDPVNAITAGIVRSGDFIYYADGDFDQTNTSTLRRAPIAGGDSEIVATVGGVEVEDIVADDQTVFVMTPTNIIGVDVTTKAMTTLVTDTFDVDGELALTPSDVYYLTEDPTLLVEHLFRVSRSGGPAVHVTDDIVDTSLGEILTSFQGVPYWLSNEGISTVDRTGAPMTFSSAISSDVFSFTRDETALYFQPTADTMERLVLADGTSTTAPSGSDSLGGASSLMAYQGALFWYTNAQLYSWSGATSKALVMGLLPSFRLKLVATDKALYFYEEHGVFLIAR